MLIYTNFSLVIYWTYLEAPKKTVLARHSSVNVKCLPRRLTETILGGPAMVADMQQTGTPSSWILSNIFI